MGTSCDFRIHPDPLTKREQLLLLSLWRRVLIPCLPNQCALRTWLAQKKDIPILHGPDNPASPHSYDKEVGYEPIFQDLAMQAACNPVDSDVLHPMKAQLVALRIGAYSYDKEVGYEPIFQDLAMQAACNPVDSDVLKAQLVALRIGAYCISIEHLEVVNSLV